MKNLILTTCLLLSLNIFAQQDSNTKNMSITIHTPTNNLQESLEFYKKLNYTVVSEENPTLVSDGRMLLEINPNRFVRAGAKFYKESWARGSTIKKSNNCLPDREWSFTERP